MPGLFKVDQNEPEKLDYFLSQTAEVQRGNYNQSPGSRIIYPDITTSNSPPSASTLRVVGANRKQAPEVLAGLDEWEDQLHRELNGDMCDDYLSLIEGLIVPHGKGMWAFTWSDDAKVQTSRNHPEEGTALISGHYSQRNYEQFTSKVQRLQGAGILVDFTSSLLGTAKYLSQLYHLLGEEDWESKIFNRLIKEKYYISESEFGLRRWYLFLMGIPGVGEEVARCLGQQFTDMFELMQYMTTGSISGFYLNSGRRLGNAMEERIRSFLGVRLGAREFELPTS